MASANQSSPIRSVTFLIYSVAGMVKKMSHQLVVEGNLYLNCGHSYGDSTKPYHRQYIVPKLVRVEFGGPQSSYKTDALLMKRCAIV